MACPRCGQAALYGLIADPCRDLRRLEPAARLLAGTPGGPELGEARRRLMGGLPLLVGLSRPAAERLGRELSVLGLYPRIGPAPPGSRPLEPVPRGPVSIYLLLAVAAAVSAMALLLVTAPGHEAPAPPPTVTLVAPRPSPPPRTPEPTPDPTVEPSPPLVVAARLHWSEGQVLLAGTALLRGPRDPSGELQLALRTVAGQVVWFGAVAPEGTNVSRVITEGVPSYSVRARFSTLADLRGFEDVPDFRLEVRWDDWATVVAVRGLPPAMPRHARRPR